MAVGPGQPLLLPFLLGWFCHRAAAQSSTGPSGTITALASQSRQFNSTVNESYEPVNCTLRFNEDVTNFNLSSFQVDADTRFYNLVQVDAATFTFQVASISNANVSLIIPAGTVKGTGGLSNAVATAAFNFTYYAFPPHPTLRFDGYPENSLATSGLVNTAFITFNSTTEVNGIQHFTSSLLSMTPTLTVVSFSQVSWDSFRFGFTILKNFTIEASVFTCVNETDTVPASNTKYRCLGCDLPSLCTSSTEYPPSNFSEMEFPFQVNLQPMPDLGMTGATLPFKYDTIYPVVSLEAPEFATGPFNITVRWNEPMRNLTKVLPTFSGVGDVQAGPENAVAESLSALRLLVIPSQTGIMTININGTQETMDMAGNNNDFRRRPWTRTGDQVVVVSSVGPPVAGSVALSYSRQVAGYEYQENPLTSVAVPALAITWSGFLTATRYSVWVAWGNNQSSGQVAMNGSLLGEAGCGVGLVNCSDAHTFNDFRALIGIEYTVYVQAFNLWGENTTVSSLFVHPTVSVVADGRYPVIQMPSLLSREETLVVFEVLVPQRGFLTVNPLKVLSIGSASQSLGDQDPCASAVNGTLRCSKINLRLEVPGTSFAVFREPFKLRLTYGSQGWLGDDFIPQLRYWERFQQEWRIASQSCVADKAFEEWDRVQKVYTVAICHLTQFAVFELYSPVVPATTAPPVQARPDSSLDPAFFGALVGLVISVACICCVWYFVCLRSVQAGKKLDFNELGIRPIHMRLQRAVAPSRRVVPLDADAGPSPREGQDEARELIAGSAPDSGAELVEPPPLVPGEPDPAGQDASRPGSPVLGELPPPVRPTGDLPPLVSTSRKGSSASLGSMARQRPYRSRESLGVESVGPEEG